MKPPIGIPDPPSITDDVMAKCRESGDYRSVLFEWYKYVGLLANLLSCIQPDSCAVRPRPPIQFSVLIGLLNRCSRLMLANVALSHEGRFGETTLIIDRCICESAVKVQWLCTRTDTDAFVRYLADGLKANLEMQERIKANIASRGGARLVIEARMLGAIPEIVSSSCLSEAEVRAAKPLPDMASMLRDLGKDRVFYVVLERYGSHHVHGSWPSLKAHYLREESGRLVPRDHDCEAHENQFVFVLTSGSSGRSPSCYVACGGKRRATFRSPHSHSVRCLKEDSIWRES
jgi:hypothetical protein